MSFARGH